MCNKNIKNKNSKSSDNTKFKIKARKDFKSDEEYQNYVLDFCHLKRTYKDLNVDCAECKKRFACPLGDITLTKYELEYIQRVRDSGKSITAEDYKNARNFSNEQINKDNTLRRLSELDNEFKDNSNDAPAKLAKASWVKKGD